MACMHRHVSQLCRLFQKPGVLSVRPCTWIYQSPHSTTHRFESTTAKRPIYNPYPTYDAKSPYKPIRPRNTKYNPEMLLMGPLPRPKEKENEPLPFPKRNTKDPWSKENALFGQDDYIDILGDGSVQPYEMIKGPSWVVRRKDKEFTRLIRRVQYQGGWLREIFPSKYHNIEKHISFLYKKINRPPGRWFHRRKHKSRIDHVRHW